MVLERRERTSLALAALASAALAVGCTLIGAGVGSLVGKNTRKNQPPRTLAGWQIVEVKQGSDVTLSLKDGRTLAGRYTGLEQGPLRAYAERYAQGADAAPPRPQLGPGATLQLAKGKSAAGDLLGLDPGAVWLREGSGLPRRRELDQAQELRDGAGQAFDAASLDKLTSSMSVPLLSEVVLQVDKSATRTPLDQVQQVSVVRSGHATLIGALVGAAIDTAIIVAAIGSPSDSAYVSPSTEGKGSGSSCPLVASFDGSRWVLDSETFGGAIFRAAQRTDWDNLDHLAEVDGAYRLRVSNGLPETQYVDELRLVVVDHPKGSRVVPDFSGGLHLLRGPRGPLVARDLAGHDATLLVASADDRPWLSSPFGRDPNDPGQVRDGLVLDFPMTPGLVRADLLVRVRNTPFGEWLQKELLGLPGTALESWYEELNRSAEARARLQKAMIREGMIRVEVLARGGWRETGFVWEVGPLVWKDLVVPLDVSDVAGERVSVRLSATAGLWLVDRVALEPGSALVEAGLELQPTLARDERESDVLPLLLAADGRHYAMPEVQNRAELLFPAPARTVGLDRSFVLKSTGYYLMHVTPRGTPQLELMSRLVNEPGAYGRFALGLLQGAARGARAAD